MHTGWSNFVTIPTTVPQPLHHHQDSENKNLVDYEEELNSDTEQNRLEMIRNLSLDIDEEDFICRFKFITRRLRLFTESKSMVNPEEDEGPACPDYFDSVLCWPHTNANSTISLGCPEEIFGIKHETQYNVTRFCFENGTWARANYTGCTPIVEHVIEPPIPEAHLTIMYYMYWAGYCVSLIFLLVALTIFLHYKSLWCLRNIIHTNLILCFALHNLTWIFYALIAHEIMTKHYQQDKVDYCFLATMIIKYFIAAGFFWMFVEGVYLFVSVMFSFHTNRIRFWMCASIGWGVPFLLILFTSIAWVQHDNLAACWMEQYQLDYIFIVPVLGVLFMNVLFLMIIMYVVVTKLQTTVRLEATRYKKAIKALFILCPLLGMNYIVVVAQTANEPMWLRLILSYYNTIMSSIQGLLVAVFFCFRNNEVRITIGKSVRRWRQAVKHQNSNSTIRESINSEHQFGHGSPGRSDKLTPLTDFGPHRTRQNRSSSQSHQSRVDYSKLCNVVVMGGANGGLRSFRFRCEYRKYTLPQFGRKYSSSESNGTIVSNGSSSAARMSCF